MLTVVYAHDARSTLGIVAVHTRSGDIRRITAVWREGGFPGLLVTVLATACPAFSNAAHSRIFHANEVASVCCFVG